MTEEILGFKRESACRHGIPARGFDTWCIEKGLCFPAVSEKEHVKLQKEFDALAKKRLTDMFGQILSAKVVIDLVHGEQAKKIAELERKVIELKKRLKE